MFFLVTLPFKVAIWLTKFIVKQAFQLAVIVAVCVALYTVAWAFLFLTVKIGTTNALVLLTIGIVGIIVIYIMGKNERRKHERRKNAR